VKSIVFESMSLREGMRVYACSGFGVPVWCTSATSSVVFDCP
jgi:hypothetical protein